MPKFKVRFLIHRTKTNQSGERRDYYFWSPPKKVQERYGLAPVRLARELSEVAAPNILLETAIAEAALLNAEYDRKRATPVAVDPATVVGTLPWVIAEFKKSPKWFRLSNATRSRTYEYGFGVLKKWSAEKNHPHIKHITRRHCYRLYLALCNIDPITEEMQLASAKNVMSTLRRLLGFAQQLIDGFTVNPATKLEVVTPESRKQIWEDEELQRLLETARAAGRPSIGLAAVLGSELAQRRGDTLKLTWEQYEAPTKGMRRGSFLIRQKKTNAIVRVPVTKRLFEVLRKINRREGPIVRNEKTGEAYVEDTFAHGAVSSFVEKHGGHGRGLAGACRWWRAPLRVRVWLRMSPW